MTEWADESRNDRKRFPQGLSAADRRQERHDLWDALNKALNTLMVGHAAGLVTCLTLLKDYKENSQLEGLGLFITLFGCGLIVAVISVMVWVLGRGDYVVLPGGKPFKLPPYNCSGGR